MEGLRFTYPLERVPIRCVQLVHVSNIVYEREASRAPSRDVL